MNIIDIARKARVSSATVSRVINGSAVVREMTAERVRRVMSESGYIPNSAGRSLRSGRSQLLGVVISDIMNPFFPELITSFERLALNHSYELVLANTNYIPERLEICLRRMLERRVEGIAIMTSEMLPAAAKLLSQHRIPIATLAHDRRGEPFHTIVVDYTLGLREALDHLTTLGHRDIAYIAGPEVLWSARKRKGVFLAEMRERNLVIRPEWILEGNHTVEGGHSAMQTLIRLRKRPTAIINSNDLTAVGAAQAIRGAGLRVPRHFSLIGFDDIQLASLVTPALTTIRIPRAEIAERAFHALTDERSGSSKGKNPPIKTSLIVRDSTSAVHTAGPASR